MPHPGAVRLSTWIGEDTSAVLRIYSTVTEKTQRSILEEALRDYFMAHPLDMGSVNEKIERIGEDDPDQ